MKIKSKGFIFFSKKIKDSDLYIKLLSSNDQIKTGIVYGGNSSKKRSTYQEGYFINYTSNRKNENLPFVIVGEITKPFLGNIINDKYKLNALLSILGLINSSILEGQSVRGIFISVEQLFINIINQKHWIIYYCEWLFYLLKIIGYEIDYKNNNYKYYDFYKQEFNNYLNKNSLLFPHDIFENKNLITFEKINTIFVIFESIFVKNHLDNINYKMPNNYINFKKIILNKLRV
jgi:hypothetical protein